MSVSDSIGPVDRTDVMETSSAEPRRSVSRQQAEDIVRPHVFMVEQYKAVSVETCYALLGERCDMMLRDPIRNKGPKVGTVYPWNVVDYLSNYGSSADHDNVLIHRVAAERLSIAKTADRQLRCNQLFPVLTLQKIFQIIPRKCV